MALPWEQPAAGENAENHQDKKERELLPWEPGYEEQEQKKPREIVELSVEYLTSQKVTDQALEQAGLTEDAEQLTVHFNSAYNVGNDAPEDIKRLADSLINSKKGLLRHIVVLRYVRDQLREEVHPLQSERAEAEANQDAATVVRRDAEIKLLQEYVDNDLEACERAAEFAQDRNKWEETLRNKAGLVRRHHDLMKMVDELRVKKDTAADPKEKLQLSIDAVKAADEALRIVKLGNVGVGSPEIKLYLYHHPNTAPDMRFADNNV